MAVDEAVLDASLARPDAPPTFRWYAWREATLSLGYFQSLSDRPAELAGAACVRRLSGGGAILHHHELTYSLVLPPDAWPADSVRELVKDLHGAVAAVVVSDPPLELHPGRKPEGGVEPFLCFQRRSLGDLVLGPHKVLGSAQRNRRSALMQHGSILLQRSAWTPRLPGILDGGAALPAAGLPAAVLERLAEKWGFRFEPGELTADERDRAARLADEKYRSPAWTGRR